MARRPRPVADALIAVINHKTLVTRNQADFADTGVDIVNP